MLSDVQHKRPCALNNPLLLPKLSLEIPTIIVLLTTDGNIISLKFTSSYSCSLPMGSLVQVRNNCLFLLDHALECYHGPGLVTSCWLYLFTLVDIPFLGSAAKIFCETHRISTSLRPFVLLHFFSQGLTKTHISCELVFQIMTATYLFKISEFHQCQF